MISFSGSAMGRLVARGLLLAIFLTFSFIGLFGCSPAVNDDKELSIPLENDIQTLDPAALSDPHTSRVVWQIYEGLVGLDEDGEATPLLASSWDPTDDHSTWTFELRPDVYFHRSEAFDSEESTRSVRARDVVYSFERYARSFGSFVFSDIVEGYDAFVRGDADEVSGFEVVDSLTVRMQLRRSDPSFVYRLTSPYLSVMPQEVVEAYPEEFGETVSAGTGPFTLENRTDNTVRLVRNSDYWQETDGNVEALDFRVEKSSDIRATRYRDGTYNVMQLSTRQIPQFFDGGDLVPPWSADSEYHRANTFNVHYLGMDVERLDDPDLRRAIVKAIDRDDIIDNLLYGEALVASSPILPGMREYTPPDNLPTGIDAARDALNESAYDGRPLTLLASDAANGEEVAQVIQDRLSRVGVEVEIQSVTFNTLVSRVFGGDRPDLFVSFSEWIFSAPEHLIDVYDARKIPNPNMFGYRNEEVTQLIDSLSGLRDRNEINDVIYDVERMVREEPPVAWLYHQKNLYLTASYIDQFVVNQHNHWMLENVIVNR
jgi:peptide/nickel transport system substrate-binding protein